MIKKIALSLTVLAAAFSAEAQVKTPQPSPSASIVQTVGMTEIAIDYSRPGVKGRTVFGDLVPYGKTWRTGANKATQFSVDTKITVEGKELAAGDYAIFTVPNDGNWDVIFYSETEHWGTPGEWNAEMEAVRVNVKTAKLNDAVESFTISIDNVSGANSATLNFSWANTKATVNLGFPTEEISLKSIEKTMAGPGANDYYSAASYYLEAGKDMNEALTWIKKAVEMRGEEAFWMMRKQSLIEAKMGDKKAAIATAKRSMASAEKAGNENYVKMNKDSIAEWSK